MPVFTSSLFLRADTIYISSSDRRGVLLYGPPGSGKTSLVAAISSELQLDIYTLDLSSSSLTDSRLQITLSLTPPNCIILIEDIDGELSLPLLLDQDASSDMQTRLVQTRRGSDTRPLFPHLFNRV